MSTAKLTSYTKVRLAVSSVHMKLVRCLRYIFKEHACSVLTGKAINIFFTIEFILYYYFWYI